MGEVNQIQAKLGALVIGMKENDEGFSVRCWLSFSTVVWLFDTGFCWMAGKKSMFRALNISWEFFSRCFGSKLTMGLMWTHPTAQQSRPTYQKTYQAPRALLGDIHHDGEYRLLTLAIIPQPD